MAFFLPVVFFFFARVCAIQPAFVQHYCLYDRGNFTSNSTYKNNLHYVLSSLLTAKDTGSGFYYFSYEQNSDKVNAIGLCRGDVKSDVCRSCLNDSIYLLTQLCPQQKEAIGWFDNCMLRYSSRSIFGAMETGPDFLMWATNSIGEKALFSRKLRTLLGSLRNKTSSGRSLKKYATGDISAHGLWNIYGLLQCTPDLSQQQCDECLESALQAFQPCCSEGMKVFLPSCNARYEPYLFFEPAAKSLPPLLPPPPLVFTPSTRTKSTEGKKFIVIILPFVALSVLLTIGIYIFLRSRKLRERLETSGDDRNSMDFLQYNFKTIRDATDDFSTANKLGQGGFGIVYKGKLPNGQEVAVKRLAQGSQQGDLEFKNEVLLLAKLQHRNLVRLLASDDDISPTNLVQYDLKTIRVATDNFSISNKLGQGGFGVVYKGKLFDGQEVAVKRLAQGSQQGDFEFKNEVLLVAKLQHRNLVRLLGFCFEKNERLLIYEFLSNSSLDRFIFDPIQREYLDWSRRYKIIVGISRSLMYLHEDSRYKVIHHDLKASNILLDAELNPKVTDFGMARLCSINQSHGDTSKVKGTYGFMAPEYALYGRFSVKSDVFSFGVLLLEIVSGQKNSCFQHGENTEHLLSYTWKNWMEGNVTAMIDPILARTCIDEIMRCIHLGLLCVQENVASRPTITSVVLMLKNNSFTLPVPSRPGFLLQSDIENLPQHLDDYAEGSQHSLSESLYVEEESANQYSATDIQAYYCLRMEVKISN